MSSPDTIVVHKTIRATPEVVYAYLTESEKWVLWQGSTATLDPTPGGLFTMTMDNGMRARGQFVELIPHRRVVFSWGWIDHPGLPPGSSVVEIDLEPVENGTRLVLRHRGLPGSEIPLHTLGWNHYIPRLASVAAGDDPGPDLGPGG